MAWDYLRASYDTTAAKYEERFLDELRDKPRDRELLAGFAKSVGDPVAEIGCGPGQIGAFVRQWGRHVVGIDLSSQMVKLAKARLDGALVADVRSLPVGTASLGGLLAFYSVIHLRRTELGGALQEFHRVLRPGGRVLLSAHEGDDEVVRDEFLGERVPFVATLFELDELIGACRSTGLEVTLTERRPPYAKESTTTRLYVDATKPGNVALGRRSRSIAVSPVSLSPWPSPPTSDAFARWWEPSFSSCRRRRSFRVTRRAGSCWCGSSTPTSGP